jgi:hypothetical protein
MKVEKIEIASSPISAKRACVRAEVAYGSLSPARQDYWFDVPQSHAYHLSETGTPWLACLLPLAVSLGEPLEIKAPVDPVLLSNVRELMVIWKCWYPQLRPIPIEAEVAVGSVQPEKFYNAALFSGGVDSWFTLLHHGSDGSIGPKINDLLTVWGFDIPLDNPDGFREMRNAQQEAADAFGLEPIDIATNLRETLWSQRSDWGQLAHGCALVAAGLILEKKYRFLLVPSTHRYDDLTPWGSHPLTDPLLSTSTLRVIHDAAGFSRVEKTRLLTRNEVSLRTLHVCSETKSYENCEKCAKCYGTMTSLQLLGALERSLAFKASSVDPDTLTRICLRDQNHEEFLQGLYQLAVEERNYPVVHAIDRSFKWNRRRALALRWVNFLGDQPLVWRFQEPMKSLGRFVLRQMVIYSAFAMSLTAFKE